MQFLTRFILISSLFLASVALAADSKPYYYYADALYWKTSESIDWAYVNNLNSSNQKIAYQSGEFDFEPGFRLGVGYSRDWDTGLYFTRYETKTTDSAYGNLKSGFAGGTLGLPSAYPFYNAGHFKMDIEFNMFDWYFGKRFQISPTFMMKPKIGLEGGWINQSMRANFQGHYSTTEKIENNFWGIGPKFGFDSSLLVLKKPAYNLSLIGEFSTAYLIGHWTLNDIYKDNSPRMIKVDLANREFGALAIQGKVGLQFEKEHIALSLAYEINDWFNQLQIFDDATGGHNDDLVMQGVTLRLSYQ